MNIPFKELSEKTVTRETDQLNPKNLVLLDLNSRQFFIKP
tara:strand:- start:74 stop:193 length:120 start_codon:yes stop_codon:yes gene_type:complete